MINLAKAEKEITFALTATEFNMTWQVSLYADLMRIIKSDKKITVVTRDAYERYYGMRWTGLSKDWLNKYFDTANKYLEEEKKPSSFKTLMTEVGADGNSVQFSFVSKLFHTLKTDEPIYDRYVRAFLGIGTPSGKTPEERMKTACEIYENDIKLGFYENDDYGELKSLMLERFNEVIPNMTGVSEIKKVDFVLWALGKRKLKISEFGN